MSAERKKRGKNSLSVLTSSPVLNVFTGPHALLDFLDPGKQPPTPLVELPPALNPFHARGVRVFMKLLFMTPIFNAKLLASRNLLDEAKRDGRLKGVHTLVENSSGNKILADALLARLFGIRKVVAIVPHDIPPDKQLVLELFGVECRKELGGIDKARELGEQTGWWNPAQYHDEANPGGSQRWLGPQIFEQTRGEISVLCSGVGTGGTAIGAGRFLKRHVPRLTTIGVIPSTDEVPGVRTIKRLGEVGLAWRNALDADPLVVDVVDAYFQSLRLCSRGILAGPSGGMALAGLFKFLEVEAVSGDFQRIRNARDEVVVVVPCPDSCMLYLDKYSTRLLPEQMVEAIA
jgi:cysteine synthase